MASIFTGLDDVIHSPLRLAICAFLERAEAVEFRVIKDALDITEAHLSKQVRILTDADYVRSEKIGPGRPRTWLALTPTGREAFYAHVKSLDRLLKPLAEVDDKPPSRG